LNLLTWIGARTTTLRLGTAVLVLPWHNPVLLAEQVATLDLLSGGRVDVGIGKGYRQNEFAGFCVSMDEADDRFDECLEVMTRAWTADTPWSHRGKYWQFEGVVVEPPTAQKPHPPIWMGAGSPASIKKVAAQGYNLLLGQFSPLAQVSEGIALFKAEVEAHGRTFDPMSVAVARSLNVVMTPAEYEQAIENRMAGRRRTQRLAQRPHFSDTREAAEAGTLYGTPEDIATKLQALRDVGAAYVLLNSPGGLPSLRRFAQEVMPAFAHTPVLRHDR
jgi:alkanesulfonate monooxygenase SsuD/methylene tetrahydromethanopterin reductase-like flavin-dependent oxidoreductase (luciferase family)